MQDMKFKIEGGIDSIKGGLLIGWIWNRFAPSDFISTELWIDGNKVATDLANRSLLKLNATEEAGRGHDFALYIPRRFRDGGCHTFLVRDSVNGYELGGGEIKSYSNQIEFKRHEIEAYDVMTSCETLIISTGNGGEQRAQLDRKIENVNLAKYGSSEVTNALIGITDINVFFTICSKNFLAHARVLYSSVHVHYPDYKFYVVLCDRLDGLISPEDEPFEFIYLEDINLPNLEEMAYRYNITEFNTAVKPFAFNFLFEKFGYSAVTYLDPDLLVIDRMVELDCLLANGAEAVLTPHLLQPAEYDEVHDRKMLIYGIYNLGFVAFRNTPSVRIFISWWGRRLEHDCIIKLEEGLFVDQKWADLLPAYVPGAQILHHPGYNVAYWNLPQRKITRINGQWLANDAPLRFLHFSGNKIDDPEVFSRHSQQVTVQSIGELRHLLNYYREQVFAEGHERYRRLPYAYSWNGKSGKNEHTPSTLDASVPNDAIQQASQVNQMTPSAHETSFIFPEIIGYLLYLDWEIPKPDRDAASVTAALLMRIFRMIGYQVTFLPCSLKYEPDYFEALVADGVEVLCSPKVSSVETWLSENAVNYDICFMSRGPVIWPYLNILKTKAPATGLIFNTVDLHYLRELRQAELTGDENARVNALEIRKQELELIRECDLTIVLSSEELYTVRQELPAAPLAVLPIVFENIVGATSTFDERRDILFIGSFPHLPNIDAVIYFAEVIFPIIQRRIPDMCFKVVGANPPENIRQLSANPNIEILGFVQNLESLYEGIRLSIAPLRYGAGIKGKIGSSLCYGVPCIATPIAVEGMGLVSDCNVLVGETPEEFADAVCRAYTDKNLWQRLSAESFKFALENYSVGVIQNRVKNIVWAVRNGWRAMESAVEIDSWAVWQRHAKRMKDEYAVRVQRERKLLPAIGTDIFNTSGFCCICGKDTNFVTTFRYSVLSASDGQTMPNWREHMSCVHCRFPNRVRAALHALHTQVVPNKQSRIYITEQITQTFQWLSIRYPNLQGSEYLGIGHAPGAMYNGIRNEDIMNLFFSNQSFDVVLSLDVLEHVPDPIQAFREIYRILDQGGCFLFSVPFSSDSLTNKVRATLNLDGTVVHHLSPEYHGNPVDPENKALCFRYFGWEVLDDLRLIGFTKVRVLAFWSERQGYLGTEQYLIIAQK